MDEPATATLSPPELDCAVPPSNGAVAEASAAPRSVKHPRAIAIWQEQLNQDPNPFAPECVTRPLTLLQKLDEYLVKLGYPREHVGVIVGHLLQDGKVMVTGVRGWERLSLVDLKDRVSAEEATELFDRYMNESRTKGALTP